MAEFRGGYVVRVAGGELEAEMSGRLRYAARRGESPRPAVGDWVALEARQEQQRALVHYVLPRRTKLSRKIAGHGVSEQVIAANVDLVFVMTSLDRDLNLRRLERYLTVVGESGARAVIVLSKADLSAGDPGLAVVAVEGVAPGVPVYLESAVSGLGLEELRSCLTDDVTAALLGSSGVGKSTLVNRWLGFEKQVVADLRHIGKGRHTTSHRELVLLPGGGLVIDTPGMREIGLLAEDSEGLAETFPDVELLAAGCHFGDCTHGNEPGCAAREAVSDGRLPEERLRSYLKLRREIAGAEAAGVERERAQTPGRRPSGLGAFTRGRRRTGR